MVHKVIDRCKETTSTTGTGNLTLTGAVAGFVSVANSTTGLTSNGDTSWFCAEAGTQWEVFLGTRVSATELARTTLLASSTGSTINFSSAPTVFSTVPGAKLSTVGPAFSAYRATSNQSVSSGVDTKVALSAELFDTGGCFDSTTNYRFTPNVAGYYAVAFAVNMGVGSGMSGALARIKKNGTPFAYGSFAAGDGNLNTVVVGQKLIYMDGSTDYLELFASVTGTTPIFKFGEDVTFLTAYLAVRGG
jgi:hypothetical protein